jgi:DNA-binding NarL/FixJ family response regulator
MGGAEPGADTGSMNSRPTQVYIVEDSPSIRARLHEMLARIGDVRVVGEADAAPQAVVDILALRPDSVLLDLKLKGSNGLQVLQAVHRQMPEVAFVVLTNQSESQYRTACHRAGASYFLDKSTEFDRVPQVIAQIAALHH